MSPEEIASMSGWAATFGATLQLKGEVGFGRPCVGVTLGQSYLDFFWMEWDDDDDVRKAIYNSEKIQAFRNAAPEDAYHKHPCMAVLVHDNDFEKALRQLYDWIKYCDDNGWGVKVKGRKTFNEPGSYGAQLELMMGGLTTAELRPLEGEFS